MRRVGIALSAEPHGGGKFQYVLSILEALSSFAPDRYEITVVYWDRLWEAHLDPDRVRMICLPRERARWFFDRVWTNLELPVSVWRRLAPALTTYARRMIREQCDIWILPCDDSLAYQVAVPSLTTIFDLMHRYEGRFPENSAFGRYHRIERHFRNMCAWSRCFLVDSELGKRQVMESYNVGAERLFVLPYLAPSYLAGGRDAGGAGVKYDLPPKFIFYPAQFWEHKNHRRLINAVGTLKRELPDLKLVLVGAPKNAYAAVVRQVAELGLSEDVIFLGYVPNEEMPGLYRRAHAMIMPTFFGPTNIPPIEAQALGCPVAVSNIYAMSEQVGDAALLFDPTSEREMVDVIRRLWLDDDLCADLVSKGRARARLWGKDQHAQRLREIIDAAVPRDEP